MKLLIYILLLFSAAAFGQAKSKNGETKPSKDFIKSVVCYLDFCNNDSTLVHQVWYHDSWWSQENVHGYDKAKSRLITRDIYQHNHKPTFEDFINYIKTQNR